MTGYWTSAQQRNESAHREEAKKNRGQVTATADDSLTGESRDSPSVDVTLTGGFTPVTAREREHRQRERGCIQT